jgi:hypothetical protein
MQSALDSLKVSNRGLRPNASETLKSLAYKGYVPFSPSASTFNTAPVREKTNSRAPLRSESKPPPRSSVPSRKEVLALATEISRLADTPRDAWGRSWAQLGYLIRDYGYDEALKIIHEAWSARATLLTEEYPTFTAQSVLFFARYRRKSNRTAAPLTNDISFERLIQESHTPNGDIDYERLRNNLILYDMQRTRMHDAICEEYGLNPAIVFNTP